MIGDPLPSQWSRVPEPGTVVYYCPPISMGCYRGPDIDRWVAMPVTILSASRSTLKVDAKGWASPIMLGRLWPTREQALVAWYQTLRQLITEQGSTIQQAQQRLTELLEVAAKFKTDHNLGDQVSNV